MAGISVLFVCLGNICRSPTAEAVFRKRLQDEPSLLAQLEVDSAGTAAYHVGEAPDPRSQRVGARFGYDLSVLRARAVIPEDFDRFDYILAMDSSNLQNLQAIEPENYQGHLGLFLDFAGCAQTDVPDPYYGQGDSGFVHVIELIEQANDGFISHLKAQGRLEAQH